VNAYISDIASYLPKTILDNKSLSDQYPEWSIDKIYDKTGILTRHIAAKEETCLSMAVSAARNLLAKGSINKTDIDYILLCTQSPDYLLPTTACLVQSELEIPTSCGALDFNLGCSGYVYGLSLAKGLIETGQAKNVLIITSELYSRYIAEGDKSVRTLFGDGATATLLQCQDNNGESIGPFTFGTDGKGGKNLIVPDGGSKSPLSESSHKLQEDSNGNFRASKHLYMNGAEILTFTLKSVPASIHTLLKKANLTIDEIDYVVLHQANKFMLEKLRKKLNINSERFLTSYKYYGNTVSSTIPLGLEKANAENKFKSGDKILLVGFGVGYSWAGTIITW